MRIIVYWMLYRLQYLELKEESNFVHEWRMLNLDQFVITFGQHVPRKKQNFIIKLTKYLSNEQFDANHFAYDINVLCNIHD